GSPTATATATPARPSPTASPRPVTGTAVPPSATPPATSARITPTATPASATPTLLPLSENWLARFNSYRAAAGLPAVQEDPARLGPGLQRRGLRRRDERAGRARRRAPARGGRLSRRRAAGRADAVDHVAVRAVRCAGGAGERLPDR